MSNNPDGGVVVTPLDLLHIIEGRARQIALYAQNPTNSFSAKDLLRAVAQLYGHVETLDGMLEKAQAADTKPEAN